MPTKLQIPNPSMNPLSDKQAQIDYISAAIRKILTNAVATSTGWVSPIEDSATCIEYSNGSYCVGGESKPLPEKGSQSLLSSHYTRYTTTDIFELASYLYDNHLCFLYLEASEIIHTPASPIVHS